MSSELQSLHLTLPTLAANLALDEALLWEVDSGALACDVIRLWEPDRPAVVLGRGSQVDREIDEPACRAMGIEFNRRVSGGAAVVTGPGCLMYALVLSERHSPDIRQLDRLHQAVMRRHTDALLRLGMNAAWQGTCDLTVDGRKVSGNSVRCLRHAVLYHGTFLYGLDPALIERCLRPPPRQPDYRRGRKHADFVGWVPCTRSDLEKALLEAWQVGGELDTWPRAPTEHLASAKYAHREWIVHARDVLRHL